MKLDESTNTKLHLLTTAFKGGRIADLTSDVSLIKKQNKTKNPRPVDCLIVIKFMCIDPGPHENLLLGNSMAERHMFWKELNLS